MEISNSNAACMATRSDLWRPPEGWTRGASRTRREQARIALEVVSFETDETFADLHIAGSATISGEWLPEDHDPGPDVELDTRLTRDMGVTSISFGPAVMFTHNVFFDIGGMVVSRNDDNHIRLGVARAGGWLSIASKLAAKAKPAPGGAAWPLLCGLQWDAVCAAFGDQGRSTAALRGAAVEHVRSLVNALPSKRAMAAYLDDVAKANTMPSFGPEDARRPLVAEVFVEALHESIGAHPLEALPELVAALEPAKE